MLQLFSQSWTIGISIMISKMGTCRNKIFSFSDPSSSRVSVVNDKGAGGGGRPGMHTILTT